MKEEETKKEVERIVIEKLLNSEPASSSPMSSEMTKKHQELEEESEWQDLHEGEEDMSILSWKSVNIKLNNKLFFKIVDMGNACFSSKHYTEDIQTR